MSRRSLGEAFSLCRGAARGAGMQWGMADECGRAAQWLLRARLPLSPLASALENHARLSPPDPESRPLCAAEPGGAACPLAAGALLCDEARMLKAEGGRRLGRTALPVLLAPFLARVDSGFLLEWDGAGIFLSGGKVWTVGDAESLSTAETEGAEIRSAASPPAGMAAPDFFLPDESVWARFSALAARTYVPSDAASRAKGAGAGLTDND